jgi:hypothetical protein
MLLVLLLTTIQKKYGLLCLSLYWSLLTPHVFNRMFANFSFDF